MTSSRFLNSKFGSYLISDSYTNRNQQLRERIKIIGAILTSASVVSSPWQSSSMSNNDQQQQQMIITLIEYIVLMFYFLAGTGVRPFLQWVSGARYLQLQLISQNCTMSNQWRIVWILPQSVFESPIENFHLTFKCLELEHLRYFWLLPMRNVYFCD